MILIATISGTLVFILWGISDYFVGKSGKEKNKYLITLIAHIIIPVLLLPVILWHGGAIILGMPLIIVIVIAILFAAGYASFVKALSIGPFGTVTPLGNSYGLITLIIGVTFLQLEISTTQFLVLLLIIIGIITLSLERKINFKKLSKSALPFALLTMYLWGLGYVFVDLAIKIYPWYQLLFLIGIFTSIFALLYYFITNKSFPKLKTLNYKNMPHAWQGGLFLAVGSVVFISVLKLAAMLLCQQLLLPHRLS